MGYLYEHIIDEMENQVERILNKLGVDCEYARVETNYDPEYPPSETFYNGKIFVETEGKVEKEIGTFRAYCVMEGNDCTEADVYDYFPIVVEVNLHDGKRYENEKALKLIKELKELKGKIAEKVRKLLNTAYQL